MEWILVNPQIHSTFGSLGSLEGDVYNVNEDCYSTLEEIYKKLTEEDRDQRTFRRAVGVGQNIKKDLVPILIYVKDAKIIEITIKILVNLTIPIECLLCVEEMSKNNAGRDTIFELNNLLMPSKEVFTDSRVTKSILEFVNQIMETSVKLTPTNLENVNNALLLLRNILHIPEVKAQPPAQNTTQCLPQNQILWNLFTQSIDKTLLFLIASSYGAYWSVSIVQLVALIYKDQHIGNLQKLLGMWFEASLSESSEDNESNTSPPDQGSDDSSPMLTSDPTSDSSDNGGCGTNNNTNAANNNRTAETSTYHTTDNNTKALIRLTDSSLMDCKDPELITSNSAVITNRLHGKRGPTTPLSHLTCSGPNTGPKKECMSSNSEFSDCGYVTQLENRESISTSSNEEDELQQKHFHQKPHGPKQRIVAKKRPLMTVLERKEKRRKKLVERGRTSIINMKGLMHHTPTDDDITNVLKEFTVDFLLKGYGNLVQVLHTQLLYNNINLQIDTSHFYWLLTYFLKFAAQLELDLEYVQQVLSFEILSYLTYEGVNLCEQIQLVSKFNHSDLKPCLRRIHLVISAIREFVQTIDIYKKISHLSDEDRVQLVKLQIRISSTEDLRCLFVLLLRHYQPDIYTKQYLQDLIVTNHILLIFLDNAMNRPDRAGTYLEEHLQQFATLEVMHQYGLMLEDFKTNGEYINDCIFTMMHHVGGDLGRASTLFQPNILKVFLAIWETGFDVCEDWSDLIDYIINLFMKNPRSPPKSPVDEMETEDILDEQFKPPDTASTIQVEESWTEEEIESLQWNYMRSVNNSNVIESIRSIYQEEGFSKSPSSIINQLLKQGIISKEEHKSFLLIHDSKSELQEYFNCSLPSNVPSTKDEIEVLKTELEKQNMKNALIWLQKVLLEICFIKTCFNNHTNCDGNFDMNQILPTMEAIPFHNTLLNQPVPVVPWNNEQSTAIHNQTFLILLQRLGFHLPIDSGKLFVRVPNYWSVDVLFDIACRLGPIDESMLKFSINQIFSNTPTTSSMENEYEYPESSHNTNYYTETKARKSRESVYCVQHIKKISSVVQVTELTSSTISIKETKISTIEEKSSSWMDVIMKSKTSYGSASINEDITTSKIKIIAEEIKLAHENINIMGPPIYPRHSVNIAGDDHSHSMIPPSEDSICETASVTSDLTRMYVSDEEERHDCLL